MTGFGQNEQMTMQRLNMSLWWHDDHGETRKMETSYSYWCRRLASRLSSPLVSRLALLSFLISALGSLVSSPLRSSFLGVGLDDVTITTIMAKFENEKMAIGEPLLTANFLKMSYDFHGQKVHFHVNDWHHVNLLWPQNDDPQCSLDKIYSGQQAHVHSSVFRGRGSYTNIRRTH